jgi:hypothetical protein
MLSFPKWIIAGSIAGLVGAAIWAGISYALNAEIGWIAWGIGVVVGFAVRLVAGESEEGFAPGATAAVIAIGAVLLGKYAAASLLVANLGIGTGGFNVEFTPEDMIVGLADEIVNEREAKGQKVVFPAGMTIEDASGQADYPPDIWQQAAAKWHAIPPAEQEKQLTAKREETRQMMASVPGALRQAAFEGSFGIFDALWFILAAATAYRLGHGNIASDDD